VPTARRAHPRVDALFAGVPTEADSEQVAGRDRRVPVPNRAELDAARQRALALGAQVLMDRSDDEEEPLWAYADLAGHSFCIFVIPAAGG
jgi:hypothetical protein